MNYTIPNVYKKGLSYNSIQSIIPLLLEVQARPSSNISLINVIFQNKN